MLPTYDVPLHFLVGSCSASVAVAGPKPQSADACLSSLEAKHPLVRISASSPLNAHAPFTRRQCKAYRCPQISKSVDREAHNSWNSYCLPCFSHTTNKRVLKIIKLILCNSGTLLYALVLVIGDVMDCHLPINLKCMFTHAQTPVTPRVFPYRQHQDAAPKFHFESQLLYALLIIRTFSSVSVEGI